MTTNKEAKRSFERALKEFKTSKYSDPWTEICLESASDDAAYKPYNLYDNIYLYNGTLFTINRVPSGDWYSTQLRVMSTGTRKVKAHVKKMIEEKEFELMSLKTALVKL